MQAFKMAVKSIAGNKLRAFLTMLGIIIGVMALVILVSLVNGATGTVTDTIANLGNDLLTVAVEDDKGAPLFMADIDQWAQTEELGEIAPYAQESITVKCGTATDTAAVYGVTPSYAAVQDLEVLLGRFLKTPDITSHTNVCVVSRAMAEELIGYADCLGEEIAFNGSRYTVVGVLAENEDSFMGMLGSDTLAAYIPYTSLVRLSSSVSTQITRFYVSAAPQATMEQAETALTRLLMERFEYDDDAFTVSSQDIMEETMGSVSSIFTLLLGSIAAISLIVGGIGIMNIMLVTVTERTREIGIRKAIGASRQVILRQFLLEAVVLCMLGCLIGIFLSWVILQLIGIVVSSLAITFQMDIGVVLIAVGFCLAIGVLFGLYPANKAAKMKPIDALHYGG